MSVRCVSTAGQGWWLRSVEETHHHVQSLGHFDWNTLFGCSDDVLRNSANGQNDRLGQKWRLRDIRRWIRFVVGKAIDISLHVRGPCGGLLAVSKSFASGSLKNDVKI